MAKSRVEAFRDWIDTATPGQVYPYHHGVLASDRGYIIDTGIHEFQFVPNGDIDEMGKLALAAFDAHKVHLFQRKLHDNYYEYIAMKRSAYGRLW